LGRIEAGGYDGFFSIEMFSQELWEMTTRESVERLYRSCLPLCI
jgi:predicted xylose isomerase-like sugar epimerase